jgi:hypothetical protein
MVPESARQRRRLSANPLGFYMKYDCPHCGKRIRWWKYLGARPAAGERTFLPNRAITVCPFCRADLATHTHPLEKRIISCVFVPFAVVASLLLSFPELQVLWVGLLGPLFIAMTIACGYLYRKTRNWQRFRRYDGEP